MSQQLTLELSEEIYVPLQAQAASKGLEPAAWVEKLLAFWVHAGETSNEKALEQEWQALSLAAFERDWDNEEDAIYDNWVNRGIFAK
ncbi:hypothetical protein FJZ31_41240 [Candidatus Poribacteria bacterium]|nr:hypothetical protein [Candidatus Poribacteria bacterium]